MKRSPVHADSAAQQVAPWLAAGPLVDLPPSLAALALPSRSNPGDAVCKDAAACWERFMAYATPGLDLDPERSDPVWREAVTEARARVASGQHQAQGSRAADIVLLATELAMVIWPPEGHGPHFLDFLVASYGLPAAVSIWIDAQLADVSFDIPALNRLTYFMADVRCPPMITVSHEFGLINTRLRAHLAHAPEQEWQQCAALLRAAAPRLRDQRRPLIALLLPEIDGLADALALPLPAPYLLGSRFPDLTAWLDVYAQSPAVLAALRTQRKGQIDPRTRLYCNGWAVATALRDRGAALATTLADGLEFEAAADGMAAIGLPEAIVALAKASDKGEAEKARLNAAALRWPLAAMAGLSELLASSANRLAPLRHLLAHLVAQHPDKVNAFEPCLTPGAWKVLATAAGTLIKPGDLATPAELPALLRAAPLAGKPKAKFAPLALAPLPMQPGVFWTEEERIAIQGPTPERYGSEQITAWRPAQSAILTGDVRAILRPLEASIAMGRPLVSCAGMIADLPYPVNVGVWNSMARHGLRNAGYAVAKMGLEGLPGIVNMARYQPEAALAYAIHFGATELTLPIAETYATINAAATRSAARAWLLAYPEYAACALIAPALGMPGPEANHARAALQLLAGAGHTALLMQVANRYDQEAVTHALGLLLEHDPLHAYPLRIASYPDFWTPRTWERPLLSNGKALPETAIDMIGAMLRVPRKDGVYPGIAQLKRACTPESLAGFAWDLFHAWLDAGANSKDNWAFYALGLLGNDATARQLTPLLREWPGKGLHLRAVAGLEVLEMIGSDIALLMLNGIAQKLKYKGLQDRAREKIDAIAEARGLSTEELEDRLAPDLGLDRQGSLVLDFGPRQFHVGFDETLTPFVRNATGTRLSKLPKPGKDDDTIMAKLAVARFKQLTKDARTIAAQQVIRLEQAMCAQRRWTAQAFHDFLVAHPLVRHLVQRLVWGVYQVQGEESVLQSCLRVAADGSLTDAHDEPVNLPAGAGVRLGIVHAMDLAESDAQAFGQLFADYELLQPFTQIGRDTYALADAEREALALDRWSDEVVPTGRVAGLVQRGWRRGPVRDGGGIWAFTKPLAAGQIAELLMSPGLIVSLPNEFPEQTIVELRIGLPGHLDSVVRQTAIGTVDPVVVSELIRDVTQQCLAADRLKHRP